jgi:hypothetical protein
MVEPPAAFLAEISPPAAVAVQPAPSLRSVGRWRTAMVPDKGGILDDSLEGLPPMLPVASRTAMLLPELAPEEEEASSPMQDDVRGVPPLSPLSDVAVPRAGAEAPVTCPRSRTALLPLSAGAGGGGAPPPAGSAVASVAVARGAKEATVADGGAIVYTPSRTAMLPLSLDVDDAIVYTPSRTAMLPLGADVAGPEATPGSGETEDSMTRTPTLLSRMSRRLQAGWRAPK